MASDLEERGTSGEEERQPERAARRRSREAAPLAPKLALAAILLLAMIVVIWRVITPQDSVLASCCEALMSSSVERPNSRAMSSYIGNHLSNSISFTMWNIYKIIRVNRTGYLVHD